MEFFKVCGFKEVSVCRGGNCGFDKSNPCRVFSSAQKLNEVNLSLITWFGG